MQPNRFNCLDTVALINFYALTKIPHTGEVG